MNIFTVSELTRVIKDTLEAEFPFVWVRGQVSNLGRPASGHVYFTLGDGEALLQVVWFKGSQWGAGEEGVHPLTGEVLEPGQGGLAARLADGMEVLCAGRINVYAPRGQYQLVAELVQEQGVAICTWRSRRSRESWRTRATSTRTARWSCPEPGTRGPGDLHQRRGRA
jgi:Exonuclease VII, large subunit